MGYLIMSSVINALHEDTETNLCAMERKYHLEH